MRTPTILLLGCLLLTTAATAQRVAKAVVKELQPVGFNLIQNNGAGAGQSVPHVHLHVLGGRHFAWPPG